MIMFSPLRREELPSSWDVVVVGGPAGRTAYNYVDMSADFVESCGLSPKELLKLTPNEAFTVLKNWAIAEIRKGSKSTGKLYTIWNAVKNFLKFNGIVVQGKPPFQKSSLGIDLLEVIIAKEKELGRELN